MILYLDHFHTSVLHIIKEFDHLSSLARYKINWTKSTLVPITNVSQEQAVTLKLMKGH